MHEDYFKTLHAGWKVSISEVRKMMITKVDPKKLCFRHVSKSTSTRQLKFCLADTSCNHPEKIEEKL